MVARARGVLVLPRSFNSARKLIREFKPDVVVGAGGYVSGPVVLTAALLNVPTMVMESNALPGWTNRVLARFVDKAAVTFPESLPFFRGKGIVIGNPVRREFFEIQPRSQDGSEFAVLVFGGSQGARAINEAMVAALPDLESSKSTLRILHQTGELDYDKVLERYTKAGWTLRAEVRRYIDDMVTAFANADLVVCRAGATTTAELIAAGKASIMVPFPLAADDHQRKNAEALEAAGAAKMILQQNLSGATLSREIAALAKDRQRLASMGEAGRRLARGDAAVAAVDLLEELVRGQ
jgi:UDP-N-acetylglucosamine--N-acetylmuramyl-(pentapeptide) pyrophosphoryl-undecaprenol N-acetylglucosamine transferase